MAGNMRIKVRLRRCHETIVAVERQ